jgi:hypothetical protein
MARNDDSELVYALCICTAAVITVLSSKNRPRDRLEPGSSNRATLELAQVLFGLCHKEELVEDEERNRHARPRKISAQKSWPRREGEKRSQYGASFSSFPTIL